MDLPQGGEGGIVEAGPGRWLTIIGLGEDGRAGLGGAALEALAAAELVVGGERHLALVGPLACKSFAWPSPFESGIERVLGQRGANVVVLASGDPFHYGVGATLARRVPAEEIRCFPAPSSFALAASRLGWALQDCVLETLHGRSFARIRRWLQPNAKILALSWDGETPRRLAEELTARGMGGSRIVVLETMGGPRERVREASAETFAEEGVDPLNLVAVEVAAGPGALVIPRAPGLPDEMFENDGQLTKREVRAVTLSSLAPRRGELLWDVGAGSGSVSIEWLLADPMNRAVAIESRSERAARIRRNAEALGTPDLVIVEGDAPDALDGLEAPDAVFVGGGFSPDVFARAYAALKPGGRFAANAVTVETKAALMALHGEHGGRLVEIAVSHAEPVGRFRGMRPAMAVLHWVLDKP